MNRPYEAIIGGTLATATLLGSASFAEAAPSREQLCAPIYDETSETTDPVLQRVVDMYAKKGINVQAQIYTETPDSSINNGDKLTQYQHYVQQECGFEDKNYLGVTVILKPRLFGTVTWGKADTDIPQTQLRAKRQEFIADLKDSSSPYSKDIANHLSRLYPYNVKPSTPKPPTAPVVDSPPSNEKAPDIPWLLILQIIGGLSVAAGGTVRIKRGIDLKNMYIGAYELAKQTKDQIVDLTTPIKDELSLLPDDDVVSLRKAVDSLEKQLVGLDDSQRDLSRAYRSQRLRFWPNLSGLDSYAVALENTTTYASIAMADIGTLNDDYQRDKNTMINDRETFDKKLAVLEKAMIALVGAGWDLGKYADIFKDFDSQRRQLQALIDQRYVSKSSDLMDQVVPQIDNLSDQIKQLPYRRQEADKQAVVLSKKLEDVSDLVADGLLTIDRLVKGFDVSCLADLNVEDKNLKVALDVLKDLNEKLAVQSGKKDLRSVEESERLIDLIKQKTAELSAQVDAVKHREVDLQNLAKDLPKKTDSMRAGIGGILAYLEKFANDVDPELANHALSLNDDVDRLSALLGGDKPKYLELQTEVNDLVDIVREIDDAARLQKAETADARKMIVGLEATIPEMEQEIENYATKNSRYITGRTRISLDDRKIGKTGDRGSGNRKDVMAYYGQLRNVADSMNNFYEEMKREVKDAKAEEERIRQEEKRRAEERRIRQEAERQAERERRDSYTSHSTYGSGVDYNHHGSGNSGGGSDSGGFSGGGSDSGGFSGGGSDSGGF